MFQNLISNTLRCVMDAENPEDQSQGQRLGLSLLLDSLQIYGAKIWGEDRDGGSARFVAGIGDVSIKRRQTNKLKYKRAKKQNEKIQGF